ncbi:MAG: hypothetical protein ABFD16_17125 [Thermoguttaceae bacterium]|jgi:hypothetical protein
MRWIGWMVALLLTLGWIAVEVDVAEPARPRLAASDWRRTRVGWEQPTWLDAHIPARAPALHPAVVGLLELFLSLFGLVAFAARRCHNGANPTRPHVPGRVQKSLGELSYQ